MPTLVFVYLGLRVTEPGRGHFERAAAGAAADVVGTDEIPPSFAESVRILWQVQTLRRIWYSLPFLAASIIGLLTLTSLYYEHVFHLGEASRGLVSSLAEPAQFVGDHARHPARVAAHAARSRHRPAHARRCSAS